MFPMSYFEHIFTVIQGASFCSQISYFTSLFFIGAAETRCMSIERNGSSVQTWTRFNLISNCIDGKSRPIAVTEKAV